MKEFMAKFKNGAAEPKSSQKRSKHKFLATTQEHSKNVKQSIQKKLVGFQASNKPTKSQSSGNYDADDASSVVAESISSSNLAARIDQEAKRVQNIDNTSYLLC